MPQRDGGPAGGRGLYSDARRTSGAVLAVCGVAFSSCSIALLRDVILPFVAGIVIAYFLNPAADRLTQWGVPRGVAVSAHRRRLRLPDRGGAHLPGAAAAHPGAAIRRGPAGRDLAPARAGRDVGARAARHPLPGFRSRPRPLVADDRREHGELGGLHRRLAVEPGPRAVQFPLAACSSRRSSCSTC